MLFQVCTGLGAHGKGLEAILSHYGLQSLILPH
jgi:hypothetical protein